MAIDKIVVKDRIRKDLGDISELAQDIKENGLINPPVVMPEEDGTFTLLAGERRLRAMEQLGQKQIAVRTWKTLTDEEKLNVEISENEVRKDFSKAERVEYGRRLERVEAAKAKERMSEGGKGVQSFAQVDDSGKTRDAVAEQLGIGSGEQYRKEKTIVDNKDLISAKDFADWDEGKLSTNKAFQKVKAEQARLKAELDRQKAENTALKNRPPETKTVVKEVEIVPPDYESAKREKANLNREYQRISDECRRVKAERDALLKEKNAPDRQSAEQMRKSALMYNAGIANFIEKYGGYIWLTEHLNELPEQERKGFVSGTKAIYTWALQMMNNLKEEV